MAIPIKLQVFEGPMDLLMHLIEKNKIDIYDIPIVEITDQYLAYIKQMDKEDMNVTSEFLVMAATLLNIKSKMLLPKEETEEEEEEEDPRDELVRRLLEYKMYKYMSEELRDRSEHAGMSYYKPQDLPGEVKEYVPPVNYDELIGDATVGKLEKIFKDVLRRKKSRMDPIRSGFGEIRREEVNSAEKELYIKAYLTEHEQVDFRQLLENQESKQEVIVTFLLLLEMMKLQEIHVVQDQIGGSILIEAGPEKIDSDESTAAKGVENAVAANGTETSEIVGEKADTDDAIAGTQEDETIAPEDLTVITAAVEKRRAEGILMDTAQGSVASAFSVEVDVDEEKSGHTETVVEETSEAAADVPTEPMPETVAEEISEAEVAVPTRSELETVVEETSEATAAVPTEPEPETVAEETAEELAKEETRELTGEMSEEFVEELTEETEIPEIIEMIELPTEKQFFYNIDHLFRKLPKSQTCNFGRRKDSRIQYRLTRAKRLWERRRFTEWGEIDEFSQE